MQSIIMTDSNTELPLEVVDKYNVPFVRMPYTINNQEYFYDLGRESNLDDFYAQVRGGAMPITSMLPPAFYEEYWRPMLEAGTDILFICFSSQLSGAFNCINMARETILQEFPERKITLVDTKSISGGAGLLVYEALKMRENGKTDEEILAWLEENRTRMHHWVTVNDLMHLKRGGRISTAEAVFGGILDIKPILKINAEGKLLPCGKVSGRKKAIRTLAANVEQTVGDPAGKICVILHGDCEADALLLKQQIENKVAFQEIWVRKVGPVIGTHAGPGVLAVCYLGNER